MKKELSDLVKKESRIFIFSAVLILIILKIGFYRESMASLARIAFSVVYMFMLPGYFIMIYWSDKLEFFERIAVGSLFCAGLIGLISYYMGIIGLSIKYHYIIIPLSLIAVGIYFFLKKKPQ